MKKGTLYLIPSLLGESPVKNVVPDYNVEIIRRINYFIVEEVRTARRFLKKTSPALSIDDLQFLIFNEHTSPENLSSFLEPLKNGHDTGLLSEAGLPCIADPGAGIIRIAHEANIRICPLVGPSSLLLALMASGFNGQNFSFIGYLPIDKNGRASKLKEMERNIYSMDQTQIFIEAPYRNIQVFQAVLETCREGTLLCVATELTTSAESIIVRTIGSWKGKHPDIDKKPTVFLLYH
jgi:16S rRNA (cytidine1402-2'-O)-methyltransferase